MEFLVSTDRLLAFAASFARIGGILVPISSLGWRIFNVRHCAIAALILTVVVTPFAERHAMQLPFEHDLLVVTMFRELMLGLTLGLCIRLLLMSFQIAGHLVSQMAGWQLDAEASEIPEASPVNRLFDLISIALLLAVGGHRLLISAMLKGFETFPIGAAISADRLNGVVTKVLANSFELGLRIALPLVGVVMLAGIVTGIMQRTMPRFGALASTVGWMPLVVTATLLISIGGMASCVDYGWEQGVLKVFAALRDEPALKSASTIP